MTTKPLPETIAGLERALQYVRFCRNPAEHAEAIESALTHLREKEATVRECAEIADLRKRLWKIADADVMLDLSCLADDDEAKAAQRLEMSDSWRDYCRKRAERLRAHLVQLQALLVA